MGILAVSDVGGPADGRGETEPGHSITVRAAQGSGKGQDGTAQAGGSQLYQGVVHACLDQYLGLVSGRGKGRVNDAAHGGIGEHQGKGILLKEL